MKHLGSLLIAASIVLAIYALAFMETSVEVNYPNGNSFGLPARVNNLGLLADRQNYLIGAGISLILGLAFCYLPISKAENIPTKETENKQCPQCAENIKREAKICRFCNYKYTDQEINKKISISVNYTKTGNEYKLKDGQTIEIAEDGDKVYFEYKNHLTNATKRYFYIDRHSAELSLNELAEGKDYSKTGIIQILNC